jgi:hypothetical protein
VECPLDEGQKSRNNCSLKNVNKNHGTQDENTLHSRMQKNICNSIKVMLLTAVSPKDWQQIGQV